MLSLQDYVFIDELLNEYRYYYPNLKFGGSYPIYEEDGVFKGCAEIAKYIGDKVNNSNENELTLSHKIADKFTKEIIVHIIRGESKISAGYIIAKNSDDKSIEFNEYEQLRWDDKEQKFNFVEIIVTLDEFNTIPYKPFVHELNHIYEDYNRRKSNKDIDLDSLFKSINRSKYKKIRDLVNDYSTGAKTASIYHQFCANVQYLTTPTEQNAFIATIVADVKECTSEYKSLRDIVYYIFDNNEEFQYFNAIWALYKKFSSNNCNWKLVTLAYNKINDSDYSETKVFNVLSKPLRNFRQALIERVIKSYKRSIKIVTC